MKLSSDEKIDHLKELISFLEIIGNMAAEYGFTFQGHDSSQGFFIAGQLAVLIRAGESAGRTARAAIDFELKEKEVK